MVGRLQAGLYADRASPPLLREIRLQLFQDHAIGHILEPPLPHIMQAHEANLPVTRLFVAFHLNTGWEVADISAGAQGIARTRAQAGMPGRSLEGTPP